MLLRNFLLHARIDYTELYKKKYDIIGKYKLRICDINTSKNSNINVLVNYR